MSITSVIKNAVNSTNANALNSMQQNVLDQVTDPKQKKLMSAQFQLQNYSEMIQTLTNMMKTMHDTTKAIAANFR